MRQNVDANADLPDLGRLFENNRFNAAPMKHKRKCQSANAGARDERLHGSAPSPAFTSPLQAAAGNRLRVSPTVRRLRQASARACCGSPRRGRRAGASATPRHAFHRALRLVVDRVRQARRHAYEVAGIGKGVAAVDHQFQLALEHVNELLLRRMDMRRHEGARRTGRVPGEGALTNLLGHVGLTKNVPSDVVEALASLGDTGRQGHVMSLLTLPDLRAAWERAGSHFGLTPIAIAAL